MEDGTSVWTDGQDGAGPRARTRRALAAGPSQNGDGPGPDEEEPDGGQSEDGQPEDGQPDGDSMAAGAGALGMPVEIFLARELREVSLQRLGWRR